MFRAATAIGLLLVMALAGCKKPATNPTPTPTPVELVDYIRQGGIVGINDHLVLLDNGAATLTRRDGSAAFTVDQAKMALLNQQLAAAEFDRLNAEYGPEFGCCDQFTYRIRHRGRTVRTLDGDTPDRLRPVFETLNQIIAGSGR
jgi:hypothetical protein